MLAANAGGGFADVLPELVALVALTVALDFAAAIETKYTVCWASSSAGARSTAC